MQKKIYILVISILMVSCGVRINLKFSTPKQPAGSIFLYPAYLEFKKNGRCIRTSQNNGSDSGPVTYQHLGKYKIIQDTIKVHFIWKRSFLHSVHLPDQTIEDIDWQKMEEYSSVFLLNTTKDTLWTIEPYGKPNKGYYLLTNEFQKK